MLDAKIYVVHYKKGTIVKDDDFYQPLMSGNVFTNEKEPFVGDDTNDNISEKNAYYSELTGIYWAWKNTHHEITGFCHYRRFYTIHPEPFLYKLKRFFYPLVGIGKKRFGLIYTKDIQTFQSKILTKDELIEILAQYDGVLPQARKLKYTVEEHYRRYHDINDLSLLRSILTEKYPDYLDAFDLVLKDNRLYANNICILKNPQFDHFMTWWFDMIFEFEKRSNMDKYVGYQERIMGFISERLLTVWFKKNKLNCKELQLIYFKSFKKE